MMKKLILLPLTLLIYFQGAMAQRPFKHMTEEEKITWDCDHRVFYEIFVRSFYDANGDGIGDIRGITQKLDYLSDLGIGGIWITPVNPSPSYHKYDITDYFDIDPQYGTLDDFRALVEAAHRHGIFVLIDLVVNHTSIRHPWFIASVKNDPKYRDYYIWQTDPPETHDGGWYTPRDEKGNLVEGAKYYGFFSRVMPDLNYENPEVRQEVIHIGKWWLKETGIDGFRLDGAQHIYDASHPQKNVQWWQEFTDSLKQMKPNLITIGECWNHYPLVAQYLPALTGAFNFELSWALLKSLQEEKNDSVAALVSKIRSEYDSHAKYYMDPIFLSNHDNNRILSDLENNESKARLAASMYLTLPGTPFIYYGEEIGMKGMKPDSLIREPFLWGEEKKKKKEVTHQTNWEPSQYSTAKTVKPLNDQLNDSSSMYRLYKSLIRLRRMNAALTSKDITPVTLDDVSILAYQREGNGQKLLVLHNLSHTEKTFTLPEPWSAFSHAIYHTVKNSSIHDGAVKLAPYGSLVVAEK